MSAENSLARSVGLLKFLLNDFFSPEALSKFFFGRSLSPSGFLGPDDERGREDDVEFDFVDLSGPPLEVRRELVDLSSRLLPDFLNAIFNV